MKPKSCVCAAPTELGRYAGSFYRHAAPTALSGNARRLSGYSFPQHALDLPELLCIPAKNGPSS